MVKQLVYSILLIIMACYMQAQDSVSGEGYIDNYYEPEAEWILGGSIGSPHSFWGRTTSLKVTSGFRFQFGVKIIEDKYIYGGLFYHNHSIGRKEVEDIIIEGISYDYETVSKFHDIGLYGRYEYQQIWYLIPYTSINLGVRLFQTRTDVELSRSGDEFENFNENMKVGFLMGAEAGFRVNVSSTFAVMISGFYKRGSTKQFDTLRKNEPVQVEIPIDYFKLLRSPSGMYGISLKVNLR